MLYSTQSLVSSSLTHFLPRRHMANLSNYRITVTHLLEDYIVVDFQGGGCPNCDGIGPSHVVSVDEALESAFSGVNVAFLAGTCEWTTMWDGKNRNHIWYNEGNPADPLTFPETFSEFKISYLQMMKKKFETEEYSAVADRLIAEEACKILLGK